MIAKPPKCPLGFLAAVLGLACAGTLAQQGATTKPKDEKSAGTTKDDKYGYSMKEPEGWRLIPPVGITVPGELTYAWTPDKLSTLTVFIQKPGQALSPRALLDSSVNGMKAAGCEIRKGEVRDVAVMRAMWMEVVGKGTGGAIDGRGSTPTLQHWVAIPREKDVLVLLLTCPEKDAEKHGKTFAAVLESLRVEGQQTKEQKESK